MKSADLIPLATSLAAPDFKAIEPHLAALDKHLILRTFVGGYSLSEADTKLWVTLRSNKVANAFLKKGALSNLSRSVSILSSSKPPKH
jgi:glutamyl-tRNA synthetase